MTTSANNFSWYSMSDPAIIKEIGAQLKLLRLQQNMTQQTLADKSGLSRSAVSEMENGKVATTFITIIQILRTLQRLHQLDSWIVPDLMSPLQAAKMKKNTRLKASSKNVNKEKGDSTW
jgi:transcriptional regulator with XRE-family HTH domain